MGLFPCSRKNSKRRLWDYPCPRPPFCSIVSASLPHLGSDHVRATRKFSHHVRRFVRLVQLAFLSNGAALFLISGYRYCSSSGVATTLHFTYPILTALIMMVFFRERSRLSTWIAIGLSIAGVALLSGVGEAHSGWASCSKLSPRCVLLSTSFVSIVRACRRCRW